MLDAYKRYQIAKAWFLLQVISQSAIAKYWKSFVNPAFLIASFTFGAILAWYTILHDVSNAVFISSAFSAFTFKQTVKFSTALFLLIFACCFKSQFFVVRNKAVITFATVVFAFVSILLLLLFNANPSLPFVLGLCAGVTGGFTYALSLAYWIETCHEASFAQLFLMMGIGLFLTGVFCSGLLLLESGIAIALSAILPILSMLLLDKKTDFEEVVSVKAETRRRKPSLLAFLAILLSGSLVFSILVGKWMPAISFIWVNAFMPCGILMAIVGFFLKKKSIEFEVVYASIIGVVCLVSMLVLSPMFQSELMYTIVFIGAWLLVFFGLVSSIWYGYAFDSDSTRIACASIALIYFGQFLMNLMLRQTSSFDFTLLVVAVVLLALSLIILLIAQTRSISRYTNSASTSSSEDDVQSNWLSLSSQYGLTDRELDVLELLSRGNSVKRIAELLVVSESTVKFHRTNIYRKLGISSKQELIDLIGGLPSTSR